jgi:hypothetical protein
MPEGCPANAPVELSDGRIVQPEDPVTLEDLCEIVPLIIETMMKEAGQGKLAAGMPVKVVGNPSAFGPTLTSPGFGAKPGSIAGGGLFGQQSGGGGGGGFPSGGGGKGSQGIPGNQGIQGIQGPPGPGSLISFVAKVDGDFSVVSFSPFVVIPGTSISFTVANGGTAVFLIQAVFGAGGGAGFTNGQIGLRVTVGGVSTDYPLTANLMHTFIGGVGQFSVGAHASIPLELVPESYTCELIIRGDEFVGPSGGLPIVVRANTEVPLYFTIFRPE